MEKERYSPDPERYSGSMAYRRCGKSGIRLPAISLGLWHNFGGTDDFANARHMLHHAFDRGITHFDLANNYGPPAGSAEENFGRVMRDSFSPYRDELFISTKAGHDMWPGPYGGWGSRKHLMNSLEQSLRRMNLEYADVFYSHRYDPDTPLEETLQALVDVVRQGKALYIGISKYPAEEAAFAYEYLSAHHTPCLVYQGRYNMLERSVERDGILTQARQAGAGFVAFSPLAQGLLTDRYAGGTISPDSRMAREGFLRSDMLTGVLQVKIEALSLLAAERGQTLAEMALAWLLRSPEVTSVIIGASSAGQLDRNLKALYNTDFTDEELLWIDETLGK